LLSTSASALVEVDVLPMLDSPIFLVTRPVTPSNLSYPPWLCGKKATVFLYSPKWRILGAIIGLSFGFMHIPTTTATDGRNAKTNTTFGKQRISRIETK
jgi:hypothetical protein